MICKVVKRQAVLSDSIPVVYVENRDMRDPEPSDIEIASLYDKLEGVILPKYYSQPDAFAEVMHFAIALNGSFFNTQRMLAQYMLNAYYPRASASSTSTLQDNGRTESGVASKI